MGVDGIMAGSIRAEIEKMVSLDTIRPKISKAIKNSIKSCGVDLLRVAKERTPYKSGDLEKSGSLTMNVGATVVTAKVGFNIVNEGFNYAVWTNNKTYKLGKLSKETKSGGRSAMYSGTLPVGTGYLTDTAEKCKAGYEEYVGKKIGTAIANSGFGGR